MVSKSGESKFFPWVYFANNGFNFEFIGNFLNFPVFFSVICIKFLFFTSLTFKAKISEILNPQFVPMVKNNKLKFYICVVLYPKIFVHELTRFCTGIDKIPKVDSSRNNQTKRTTQTTRQNTVIAIIRSQLTREYN